MICTMRPLHVMHHNHSASDAAIPGPSTPPTHNDRILRAHEREREALLAKTHAAFSMYSAQKQDRDDEIYSNANVDEEDEEDETEAGECAYDTRGRQAAFRETVRQRQARLEFLRRQDAARRRQARTQPRSQNTGESIMTSLARSSSPTSLVSTPAHSPLSSSSPATYFNYGYPTCSSPAASSPSSSPSLSPSLSLSLSSSESDEDSILEEDEDEEDEWKARAPRVRLYVVNDSDSDSESDNDEGIMMPKRCFSSRTGIKPAMISRHQTQMQYTKPVQSQLSLPTPLSTSNPLRAHVARAPSLASIPE